MRGPRVWDVSTGMTFALPRWPMAPVAAVGLAASPAQIPECQGSMMAAGSRVQTLGAPRRILCKRGVKLAAHLAVGASGVHCIRNLQNGPTRENKHSLTSHNWRAHWPQPRSQGPNQRILAAQA